MKKKLLIVLAFFLFLWLVKAPFLSLYIRGKTGLPVSMMSVGVGPRKARMFFFKIENARGFRPKTALEIGQITIEYRLRSFFNTPSEIDRIVLENVLLNIEIGSSGTSENNWALIGSRIRQGKGSQMTVHKLLIRNLVVDISGVGADKAGVSGKQQFDEMEFDEIQGTDGFPTKDLVSQIFGKAGFGTYLEKALNPTEAIEESFNPLNF